MLKQSFIVLHTDYTCEVPSCVDGTSSIYLLLFLPEKPKFTEVIKGVHIEGKSQPYSANCTFLLPLVDIYYDQ